MDKVTDDFTHGQGATDYGKILDRLIEDLIMNNIGITIQIDGGARGAANQFQEAIPRGGNSSGSGNDLKVDAMCDVLVVRKACPHHAKGDCQFMQPQCGQSGRDPVGQAQARQKSKRAWSGASKHTGSAEQSWKRCGQAHDWGQRQGQLWPRGRRRPAPAAAGPVAAEMAAAVAPATGRVRPRMEWRPKPMTGTATASQPPLRSSGRRGTPAQTSYTSARRPARAKPLRRQRYGAMWAHGAWARRARRLARGTWRAEKTGGVTLQRLYTIKSKAPATWRNEYSCQHEIR